MCQGLCRAPPQSSERARPTAVAFLPTHVQDKSRYNQAMAEYKASGGGGDGAGGDEGDE